MFAGRCCEISWACLHGPVVKAANCRQMSPLFELWARKHLPDSPENRSIVKVTSRLNEVYHILYNNPMFMSRGAKDQLGKAVRSLGQHMQLLRSICSRDGRLLWQMTPKCHLFQHVPSQCELHNSRYVQVYIEESLMGKMAHIWESGATGPYHQTVQFSVLVKYITALAITLKL